MTAPTRIDPVDFDDLCELALRQLYEFEQNAALLEAALLMKRERENAAEKEVR